MNSLKSVESCMENKQTIAATGTSISEESSGFSTLSPTCSPVTLSPNHRRTSGPIRRAKGGWTPIEDETLRRAVELYKGRNWKKIAESVAGRTEVQCLHRWQKVLNPALVKGPWTPEEDNVIIELVAKYGATKWSVIAGSLSGRIGKQCRERWHNHLNPEIRKDAWTSDEEMELMKAHLKFGNKWAEIAKVLPGRSDNSIKNHWNSSLRKRAEVYVKTGKIPRVLKPVIRNAAKDATNPCYRQVFQCSGKELHTSGKTVLEGCLGVPRCLPTETPEAQSQKDGAVPCNPPTETLKAVSQKDGVVSWSPPAETPKAVSQKDGEVLWSPPAEIPKAVSQKDGMVPHSLPIETPTAISQKDGMGTLSAQVSELNATLDVAVRLSDSSDDCDCQAETSEINLVQNRSESVVNLDACSFNGEVCRNEEPLERILYSGSDNIGSLCYRPPQLEDLGVAAFSSLIFGHRSMQPTSDHEMISSPISYSTPLNLNVPKSGQSSVESILKTAARSFPNTPSIIKRRKEAHIPFPPETVHTNEIRIQDSCTPIEESTTKLSKSFSSPLTTSGGSLDYGKKLNFSPVYQLRYKRKATFKSLEKQLDFSMEDANSENNTKISSLEANNNICCPTNMQFLSI